MIRSKNGGCKEVTDADIIGPGFHSISSFVLRPEQKVFLTYQGNSLAVYVALLLFYVKRPRTDETAFQLEYSLATSKTGFKANF